MAVGEFHDSYCEARASAACAIQERGGVCEGAKQEDSDKVELVGVRTLRQNSYSEQSERAVE